MKKAKTRGGNAPVQSPALDGAHSPKIAIAGRDPFNRIYCKIKRPPPPPLPPPLFSRYLQRMQSITKVAAT
ncbi:hypothetical protein MTP99_019635 [Tenebrio molitor]|nr:hypothetical protein MTP99_019635 [Tenebrio molitor]